MARLSRSIRLLRNAEAALISAIEIYNKPSFGYREETFAILALNAWELLLKAKVLDQYGNDIRSLYVYEKRKTLAGLPSTKQYLKKNRTGNPMTIGIEGCIGLLMKKGVIMPEPVKKNLDALIEIRDNAIHFINASPQLAKQVLEIGTACLRNFIELGKAWLNLDLSSYSLYLMPIGFLPSTVSATAIALSNDEQRVVNYLAGLVQEGHSTSVPDYHVSLDVNISFKRTSAAAATAVIANNPTDPSAIKVQLSEEDIRKQYPWDYATLSAKLKERYIDFKETQKYHDLRKKVAANPQFMKTRYLDPGNPKSIRKDFYSPNIIAEFDKSYTRKS